MARWWRIALEVGSRHTREDVVGLSKVHEVGTGDVLDLTVLVEAGGVPQGEQDTTGRPGELVAERVTRSLGGGQTTAVREERGDLASLLVNLLDGLDGVCIPGSVLYYRRSVGDRTLRRAYTSGRCRGLNPKLVQVSSLQN